ncbi:MAG TPA: response regulator, partial [Chloroflexota bacterium]|nr:response regulator [Chloroflexota bacterium]
MVVEDDATIRELMMELLREQDFEQVLGAANPARALALAQSNELDLVVLDHCLGGESGIEVAEQLRALPDFSAPVLVTTALPRAEAEKVCAEADACECVLKPFDITEFLAAVQACLRDRGAPLAA